MSTLSAFNKFTSDLKETESLMPVLFIGHGSPMNGIEYNEFSNRWKQVAKKIPTVIRRENNDGIIENKIKLITSV